MAEKITQLPASHSPGLGSQVPLVDEITGKTSVSTVGELAESIGSGYDSAGSADAVKHNLDLHEANTSNPHGVTSAQVGADPIGSADDVQDNLDTHTGNTSNPHGTTAVQVGADISGAAAAVQGNLNTHTSNTSNPHSVTAAQAGADPAGSAATVAGNLSSHTGNTSNPHYTTAAQAGAVALTGDETVAGKKSFSTFPETPSSDPTTNYQVANKHYVDSKSGGITSVVAGTNVTVDNTDPKNPVVSSTAGGTGDVMGPSGATDGNIAVFDTNTGKKIKDGGVLGSAAHAATTDFEAALAYTPENVSNKATDNTMGGATPSDTYYPSQKAAKEYIDQIIATANALVYKGVIDCSGNPNYPAADAGHLYIVSVAGKIGGASGIVVEVGDMCICNTDNTSSGNQATVGTYWNIVQKNIDGAVVGPTSATDNHIALFDSITGKIIKDGGHTLSEYALLTGATFSGAINEKQGADVASATPDIGAATGNYVNVTGTTTITALGTIQAGAIRFVTFTGALILTHHATALILPTSANITTVAGDNATFISLGSGNWICVSYQRNSGIPLDTGTIPVTKGGTGLTTIADKKILVTSSADTVSGVTIGAGQSIRRNAGDTAFESYTPSAGTNNFATHKFTSAETWAAATLSGAKNIQMSVDASAMTGGSIYAMTETSTLEIAFSTRNTLIREASSSVNFISAMSGANDLTNTTYASKTYTHTQSTGGYGIALSSDGTKFYVADYTDHKVYQYTLSTAFDISTASYASKSYVMQGGGSNTGIAFSQDGTKMYNLYQGGRIMYQYTLSTPWDVSTASYDTKTLSVSSQTSNPQSIFFSYDGSKVYTIGNTSNTIYQYTLSTPWDLSTGSYASKSIDVTAQDGEPYGGSFSRDGKVLMIVGNDNNKIYQYNLTTGYDLSTATYSTKSVTVTTQTSNPVAMCGADSGSKFYVEGGSAVWQYNTGTAFAGTGFASINYV